MYPGTEGRGRSAELLAVRETRIPGAKLTVISGRVVLGQEPLDYSRQSYADPPTIPRYTVMGYRSANVLSVWIWAQLLEVHVSDAKFKLASSHAGGKGRCSVQRGQHGVPCG